jgi:predicted nuclease with RNAse H fold
MSYLGIDVTGGSRPFSFVLLDELVPNAALPEIVDGVASLGWIPARRQEIVALAERLSPDVIAIDAPSGVPAGLRFECCFEDEPACDCEIEGSWDGGPQKMRIAEHELAAMGLGGFPTNKDSPLPWKALVREVMPVWDELAELGYRPGVDLIETFPYAAWRRLAPSSVFEWRGGVKNDLYDAVLCALVAGCHHRGGTETLGEPEEGFLVIPSESWRGG